MSKNPDVPDGWAMPDDLGKKVSEALNRKSITPEQELQDALDEMARGIALIEPDPQDWGGWVTYLLEQLEMIAEKDRNYAAYESMLLDLRETLETRIKGSK